MNEKGDKLSSNAWCQNIERSLILKKPKAWAAGVPNDKNQGFFKDVKYFYIDGQECEYCVLQVYSNMY